MESSRNFPDPCVCRLRHISGDLFECEAVDARHCPHNFEFGFGYYCKHPERHTHFKNTDEQPPDREKS